MENLDVLVLRTLHAWRAASKRALLATVVRTWGSSPRPLGSIMALCEDGAVVGSVSGGCIEDDLIYRYTQAYAAGAGTADRSIPAGAPRLVKYGVTADEAHRFGLPCGGTLEMLLEFDPDPGVIAHMLEWLGQGKLVERRVQLDTGHSAARLCETPSSLAMGASHMQCVFGPEYRMLIIGAGQMSEYLATMALFSGFAVTVCDPRSEYTGSWAVPGAALLQDMPDDVVRAFQADRRCAIVALTHDPKLDDLALLEALETPAFYIGAIGSRRNNQARRERMVTHFEQTEASLRRLRGPIGIYIGSKTPAEIAVSVMAEILAVKNAVPLPRDIEVAAAKNSLAVRENDAGSQVCYSPEGA